MREIEKTIRCSANFGQSRLPKYWQGGMRKVKSQMSCRNVDGNEIWKKN